MTVDENGNQRATHERLLKAEAGLLRLIRDETLFTYLTFVDITVPTTNNRLEGGVNAQLRGMLRDHRGLSLERRLKGSLSNFGALKSLCTLRKDMRHNCCVSFSCIDE